MPGYSLHLPPPWRRISLGPQRRAQTRAALDLAISRAPKEIPPDRLAVIRRGLERELDEQLEAAAGHGGVDFYFPAHDLHGVSLNASFVVSSLQPGTGPRAPGQSVGAVLAELVAGGAEAVTIAETVWVRSEHVERSDGAQVQEGLRTRQVDYLTALPADPSRWVLVACSVLGDGDPDSLPTAVVVELFDAIMTTWRWNDGGESQPGLREPT